ncbi:MAG: acetoacetate decarboxylase family protein [Actinomycetota bacterium]|nr:acetoacetate decarboxylase family protein [Actinomycetota bacterium]
MTDAPTARPGEIAAHPKLNITYRTDPDRVAALLPPGIDPVGSPDVHLGVYCVPIRGEPEYGVSTKVDASWNGVVGQYSLGIGIDQEAAIFISAETNGQHKFPCSIRYFRLGDRIEATCTHQGYTFLEYRGTVTGEVPTDGTDLEHNEWWTKYSRAVGGAEGQWDYPPHVVHVRQVSEPIHVEALEGNLVLRESPWDPYTELLPVEEIIEARLVTSLHKEREITNAGPLDPDAFWPYADTIGGSRWPGERGGPRSAA